ncbi:exodeoxyribonuclease I [Candidatus Liberibacter asiaticus]|uniref:Exodeoxyribonuclease I n=3 Tax=Liberibacter asiaticus TaxID=34021 RepID=C6XFI1_LIBAP|nr:exodeoxyribonuclease I [Candidatus Liberibacter asiaticus]ACT57134.1 exonuclease I [Candidatus Liberibacter asiaticus str. psy62]AGH16902.1 exonuclease I [Candidatus Liberibacter asiaticus str. gxpsy]ALK07249.1 exodeoxyribonuclease I [Candidatus Liberibacter asiaticus]ASK52736.1 exodeoxyribonuclease I [Candidatus Liberibacter asiaticus]AWL14058.1 exodeoxyribonuclease I [Candidatus Liberibacter asiaticus]
MTNHFVIYDYETFGRDVALDRPAQFAGVRVDRQWEKIESTEVFFCKPADDYLPDPEAVFITGITPQKALRDGVVEAEFSRRIHQFFSVPNTCIIGYNNIRFDDYYSRNIFYRNFYDSYRWSWDNGNSRWDLLDVMRAIYAFSPDGIQWPSRDDGATSFKLQDLALANGIEHVNAHDAKADVYATLALVWLIREKKPKLFEYLYDYRNKNQLRKLIDIQNMTPLVHVSGMFGASRSNTALIAPVAWHPRYKDSVIGCNLSGDMRVFQDLDSVQLAKRLFTSHDELKGLVPVPIKEVHLNKCPILMPIDYCKKEHFERWGIDHKRCLENLTLLRQQTNLRDRFKAIYNKPYTSSSQDVDSQLYDGFFADVDRQIMDRILRTAPEQLSTLNLPFSDRRLPELFFRYRARNFPHTLSEKEKQDWLEHRKKMLTRSRIEEYKNKLQSLSGEYKGDEGKEGLINALYEYLQWVIPKE